jgi:arsenate reductase (glutaredoxin)
MQKTKIQIFGSKKCKDTQKAIRFFKERGHHNLHIVDINEKPISKGEWENIFRKCTPEECLDRNSKEFEKLNLKYIQFNPRDLLIQHPQLAKTPIVRMGKYVGQGVKEDLWKEMIEKG